MGRTGPSARSRAGTQPRALGMLQTRPMSPEAGPPLHSGKKTLLPHSALAHGVLPLLPQPTALFMLFTLPNRR